MRLCKLALIFGVVALLASPALAQPGRGGFRMAGPALLRAEKVQKDLDLSKEQITKANDAIQKSFEDNRENFQKLFDPNTSQEDREAIVKKMTEANEKLVKDILNEKQQKRFKQIERQQTGIALFQDAAFVKELKLGDKQKDEIKEIAENLQKEVTELFQGGFKPETRTKAAALRKEAMASAMKVLNDDQKKQVKEMFGTTRIEAGGLPRPTKPAKPADF